MVMMWRGLVSLMTVSMLASVVVLPEPVGPVTRTRPRGRSSRSRTEGGMPMVSRREQLARQHADGRGQIAALADRR